VRGLRLIGTAANKASVLSFVIAGIEPEKIAQHLDQHGIAARAGHHCAQPALRRFGVEKTVRASLAFYNTRQEVDTLVRTLRQLPRA
jgi:cysteine desulfurase/selenocysteine lyase